MCPTFFFGGGVSLGIPAVNMKRIQVLCVSRGIIIIIIIYLLHHIPVAVGMLY